jgi:hypothetical protein
MPFAEPYEPLLLAQVAPQFAAVLVTHLIQVHLDEMGNQYGIGSMLGIA